MPVPRFEPGLLEYSPERRKEAVVAKNLEEFAKLGGSLKYGDGFSWGRPQYRRFVEEMQTYLKALGYYTKKIDGLYGKGTKMAVMLFGRDYGYSVGDGSVAHPAVILKIIEVYNKVVKGKPTKLERAKRWVEEHREELEKRRKELEKRKEEERRKEITKREETFLAKLTETLKRPEVIILLGAILVVSLIMAFSK